jgi:adenine specific DNA methylase Mod
MAYIQDENKKTEGNTIETQVSDDNTQQLLEKILVELRIANLHLSKMTDMLVTDNDIKNEELYE